MHPVISAYLNWQRLYNSKPSPRFSEEWYDWTQRIYPAWEWFDELTDSSYRYEYPNRLASPFYRSGL